MKVLFATTNPAKIKKYYDRLKEKDIELITLKDIGINLNVDWQEDAYAGEKTVMVHIRRIREKIEITPKNPKYLKVVWGIGYKIEKYD